MKLAMNHGHRAILENDDIISSNDRHTSIIRDSIIPTAENIGSSKNLDGLKEKSQHTFVAIDFEGLIAKDERIGITEIGIAVLSPPVSDSRISEEDLKSQGQTPQAFLAQNAIESHWIKIKGRERRERSQDRYYFGQAEETEAEQCETAIVSLLQAIRQRFRSPLVLIGFDLVFEFKTIVSHLSQITQYFSSWVDLREIAAEISNANSPGMKDTLLAFELFRPDLAVRGKNDHNAGNDAIRQLAVLVNLLNLRKGGRLHFDHHGDRVEDRDALQKFWNQTRPRPKELYPFTARIRIQGKDLISLVPNCPRLFSLFSDYQPTAVGMTRFGKYGWVCLPSLDELNRFITGIHGQEFKGEIWSAFTDYNPQVLHLTRQQLREAKRAGQEAQREQKQLVRCMGRNTDEMSVDRNDLAVNGFD
ncbi:putative Exonuclease domain-containing protein [Seiridium cardinale]